MNTIVLYEKQKYQDSTLNQKEFSIASYIDFLSRY